MKKSNSKREPIRRTAVRVNRRIFICFTIIIAIATATLFELIGVNNPQSKAKSYEINSGWPLLGAEAGSKSKEKSSRTTVIAIDGGGGGGKPHPVPVPWPVVHCHHHHHHLKYIPKPILVHHWVKKQQFDLAASAPESFVMGPNHQPPTGGSTGGGEFFSAAAPQASRLSAASALNPYEMMIQPSPPVELNGDSAAFAGAGSPEKLAYELSEGSRLVSTINNVFDDSHLDQPTAATMKPRQQQPSIEIAEVVRQLQSDDHLSRGQLMAHSGGSRHSVSTSRKRHNATKSAAADDDIWSSGAKQSTTSSSSKFEVDAFKASSNHDDHFQQQQSSRAKKPSHPFDNPHDQLIDETRHEAKTNKTQPAVRFDEKFLKDLDLANVLEQKQAKRLFEHLTREQTNRLQALPLANDAVPTTTTTMGRPIHDQQQAKPTTSGSAISARAQTNSLIAESQAIQLMTKLASQMAQLEAKKLIDKQQQKPKSKQTNRMAPSNSSAATDSRELSSPDDSSASRGRLFRRMNILSLLFSPANQLKSHHRDRRRFATTVRTAPAPQIVAVPARPLAAARVMMMQPLMRLSLEKLGARSQFVRPRAEQKAAITGDLQSVESSRTIRTFNLSPSGSSAALMAATQLSSSSPPPPRPTSALYAGHQPLVASPGDDLQAQSSGLSVASMAEESTQKFKRDPIKSSRQRSPSPSPQPMMSARPSVGFQSSTSTTLSPDLESRFYHGQREHLSKILEQTARDQLVDDQMAIGVALNPKSNLTRVYSPQSSEVHNSILEPESTPTATPPGGGSSEQQTKSDTFEQNYPASQVAGVSSSSSQQTNQMFPPAPAPTATSNELQNLILQPPPWPMFQQQQLVADEQQPTLMKSYIEFPISPQQWSSEALRSMNSLGSQQQSSWLAGQDLSAGNGQLDGDEQKQATSAEADADKGQHSETTDDNAAGGETSKETSLPVGLFDFGPPTVPIENAFASSRNLNFYGNLAAATASQSLVGDFDPSDPTRQLSYPTAPLIAAADYYKSFASNPYETIFWRPPPNYAPLNHQMAAPSVTQHFRLAGAMQPSGSYMKPSVVLQQDPRQTGSYIPPQSSSNYPLGSSPYDVAYSAMSPNLVVGPRKAKGLQAVDPLDEAQNDMNQLSQMHDYLSKSVPVSSAAPSLSSSSSSSQPLVPLSSVVNSANNFTSMTRFSNQLRSTGLPAAGLQGRLPQMPNIPNIPQPPQMPGMPPGMMQMASLALPFAMARATRNNRFRNQQVNAAAQGGGSTAGQRFFNGAARLLRRRPLRGRRPTGSPSHRPATRLPNLSSPTYRNRRLQRFIQTVVDVSRRTPASSPIGAGPKGGTQKLAASALAVAANGAAAAAISSAKMKPKLEGSLDRGDLVDNESNQLRGSRSLRHLYLQHQRQHQQTGSILAAMNDGSLARFASMTSPIDMLNLQLQERPPQLHASSRHEQYELIPLQAAHSRPPPLVRPQASQQLSMEAPPPSLAGSSGQRHAASATTQLVPFPMLANHINFVLFTAQNLTNHSSTALPLAYNPTTLKPVEPVTNTETDASAEDSTLASDEAGDEVGAQAQESLDGDKQHEPLRLQQQLSEAPEQKESPAEERDHRQAEASSLVPMIGPAAKVGGGLEPETNRPRPNLISMTNSATTSTSTTAVPHLSGVGAIPSMGSAELSRPTPKYKRSTSMKPREPIAAPTTTVMPTIKSTSRDLKRQQQQQQEPEGSSARNEVDDYVRAIKLVREVAYPWPPPTKSSAAATSVA